MFNKKFLKIAKWLLLMKKKHNTYAFKLLCSTTEVIIYVENTEDEIRIPL